MESDYNSELRVAFSEYWKHTRQCVNERLWYTAIYGAVVAAILYYMREIRGDENPVLIMLPFIFGLAMSVGGLLMVIATTLGYRHYIADITMIVYYWDKMEFYKHQEKPIRFGDVHRLLFEFFIALFIVLSLGYMTYSNTTSALFDYMVWSPVALSIFLIIECLLWLTWRKYSQFFIALLIVFLLLYMTHSWTFSVLWWVIVILGIFFIIEWMFQLKWEKYFQDCMRFASILKSDTEGRYRSDWERWFKTPHFHERIIRDAEKRKVRDLIEAFSPGGMTDVCWQNLHPDEMNALGKMAAVLLGNKKIVLGADSRKNSLKMLKKFKKGYRENGGKVVDCGRHCTTPMIEFLGRHYNLTSVMITASHLDETWQGIKITYNEESQNGTGECEEKALKVGRNGEKALRDYIVSFPGNNSQDLKLTVDYFEGSVARIFPEIAKKYNIKIREFNAGMSGNFTFFPTMSPDPSIPENIVFITKVMGGSNAQLGVAFDGDGDRYVIILKQNNMVKAIDPVLLTVISAMYYKDPGTFVIDPFVVPAESAVKGLGHDVVRVERGRSNMISKIKQLKNAKTKVHKGVEGTYHSYDSETFDDAIRQFLEFCKYWNKDINIKGAKDKIGFEYTLEMRVECKDEELFKKEVTKALLDLGLNKGTEDCIWIKNFIVRKSSRKVVSFLFYGENPRKEMERVKEAISTVYKELAENLEKEFNTVEQQKKELYW